MKKRNNAGYSLVELIIVLGIIAVLSGLAAVTISAISTARATSAKESSDEELSTLVKLTKSQNKKAAMLIEKVDDKYQITYGTFTGDVTRKANGDPSDDFKDRAKLYCRHINRYYNAGSRKDHVRGKIFRYRKRGY